MDSTVTKSPHCGCSQMWYISTNPQVAATQREIYYFSNDINYKKGIKWYREQMPVSNHNQITIEKTPTYLVDPNAAERVFKLNPTRICYGVYSTLEMSVVCLKLT